MHRMLAALLAHARRLAVNPGLWFEPYSGSHLRAKLGTNTALN
jgi:hypothetical protein